MPESTGPWRKPDPLGAILSMVGMTALIWSIIELPKTGLFHPATLTAAAVAVVALVGFGVWEARCASPMVPMALFRDRNFSGASFSLVLLSVANGGLLLVLTQYLQFVQGYTPTEAGLAFIPMAVTSLLFNGIGAAVGNRIGNRPMVAAGLIVVAGGFFALATSHGFWTLMVALAVLGVGSGLAMPTAIAALMGAVPAEHAGVGSALNDTIQQAGAALGVAVLGSVLAGTYTGHMPESASEPARRSLGDALAEAAHTGDAGLAAAARDAFSSGMSVSFTAAACGVLVAALIAVLVLRDRKTPPTAESDAAESSLASVGA
jgi:MFS family permease